jgi:hypothetical protein
MLAFGNLIFLRILIISSSIFSAFHDENYLKYVIIITLRKYMLFCLFKNKFYSSICVSSKLMSLMKHFIEIVQKLRKSLGFLAHWISKSLLFFFAWVTPVPPFQIIFVRVYLFFLDRFPHFIQILHLSPNLNFSLLLQLRHSVSPGIRNLPKLH